MGKRDTRGINPNKRCIHLKYMIEITTKCNLKCPQCEHTYWNEKSRDMPFDCFKRILNVFTDCNIVDISGIGEPLCHPQFNNILRYACEKVPVVEFTTNLQSTLSKEFIDIIRKYRPKINLSWEGYGKENYEKSRVGGLYEKLIGNLDLIPRELITVNYLVNKITYKYVFKFSEMCKSLGIKSIRYSIMAPFKENSFLMLDNKETEEMANEFKKINGIEFSFGGYPTKGLDGCPFITADGYVIKPPFGAYVTQSIDREKMIETYSDFNIMHRLDTTLELSKFTGLDGNTINKKMMNANNVLIEHWNAINPKSNYEREQFYKNEENWIFDLLAWGRPKWIEKINSYLINEDKKILDFGCGTGDFTIGLSLRHEVEYLDVKGAITTQFLKWRLKERNLKAKEINRIGRDYDAILCFDVFEHLSNPIKLIKEFAKSLKPKGLLFISTGFHDYRPMHIFHDEGKFRKSLRELFECIDNNRCEVWRLK